MAQVLQEDNLVKAMQESKEISIKGFLDDDENKQGCLIDGKRIYSQKFKNFIKKNGIAHITCHSIYS